MKEEGHIKFLIILLLLLFSYFLQAREKEKPFENMILKNDIHSVRFFRENIEFSIPVLELGSNQRLLLIFDEIAESVKNYSYTITHCDFEWYPSRLIAAEYLEGFNENPIREYSSSINTTIAYINYHLYIPNENLKIKLSGNYILTVFEENNRDNPVLIRRFYVSEPLARIDGVVKNATFDSFKGPHQEVDFTVEYEKLEIQDPITEVKAVIVQNTGDQTISSLKPLYIRNNQLIYDYNRENVFPGGNEFRNFDAKNLQLTGYGIEKIDYINPLFHVTLRNDEFRRDLPYRLEYDLNGNYLVKNDRASDAELESDYLIAHFSLRSPEILAGGDIYIYGGLSDWRCTEANKISYNLKSRSYEGALLLKQGFYDYRYVYIQKGIPKINHIIIEGSHVETENNYHIFIYHRGFSSRYDRLIGYRLINNKR